MQHPDASISGNFTCSNQKSSTVNASKTTKPETPQHELWLSVQRWRLARHHRTWRTLPARKGTISYVHRSANSFRLYHQHTDKRVIGLFCPFAHRAGLIQQLKGLTEIIDLSIVKPYPNGDEKGWPGWEFPTTDDPYEGSTTDRLFGSSYLHEVYFKEKEDYEGRYSVPVLWDKKTNRMVNNESLEVLRILNTGFDSILPEEYKKRDYCPEHLRREIDEIGKWMQDDLNTGVYKAGFAPDQETYNKNVVSVFRALNRLEELLSKKGGPYVLGTEMTELDLRLYPTLIRFDTAYVQHFKCNLGTIRHDYPLLNEWMKNLYWNVPGFKETTDFRHIKENVSFHSEL